jgi:Protein of unknown function (DUF1194)
MTKVDLALVLAVDCSSSVDAGDYHLQMFGIAKALRSPRVLDAIEYGENQRIAFALVQWSTRKSQNIIIKWRQLASQSDLLGTAAEIELAERQWKIGGTGLAAAIDFSAALIAKLNLETARRVIDISGDGEENDDGDVATSRAAAIARGISINGLPLLDGSKTIEAYYRHRVIGGPGSFLMPAANSAAFGDAMEQKLLREIGPQTS